MEQGLKTRLTTAGVLLVVFAAGLLVGLAADGDLAARPALVATESADDPAPRRRSRLYEQVGPSDVQLAVIDSVIRIHRVRTNALERQVRAMADQGFDEILAETREAIMAVLTPEQAAEYRKLLDQYDAQREAEREAERERRRNRDRPR
jgi:ribosomal protein L12E/L44/L45/RPP1/RPP2